ncbi:MAG: (2Fe-2S)-binding protein [Actinomycetota bacterium]
MYICHCRAVTDHQVLIAIEGGARDRADIARRCGAGARCGGCHPEVARILETYLRETAA